MTSLFTRNIEENLELMGKLGALDIKVTAAIALVTSSLRAKKKLMICGNGGSAADAQHLAAEFTGRFIKDRIPMAAIALTTDSSALTCISNDYSYREVFSRQLLALGQAGDCLLAISTSGNSKNVLLALKKAKELGMKTVAFTGYGGGVMAEFADFLIAIPSKDTPRIQEVHILVGHIICQLVEEELFGNK